MFGQLRSLLLYPLMVWKLYLLVINLQYLDISNLSHVGLLTRSTSLLMLSIVFVLGLPILGIELVLCYAFGWIESV